MKNIPVSELIKQKRLEKNISVETIFKEAHIPSKFVYMIENGEWNRFPSEVHLRGFLKLYVDYLKIEPELVEQCIKDATGDCREEETANNIPVTDIPTKICRVDKVVCTLMLLAVFLLVILFLVLRFLP